MNVHQIQPNCKICLETNSGSEELIYKAKVLSYKRDKLIFHINVQLENGIILSMSNSHINFKDTSRLNADNGPVYWVFENEIECYKFLYKKHCSYADGTTGKLKTRHLRFIAKYKELLKNGKNNYGKCN